MDAIRREEIVTEDVVRVAPFRIDFYTLSIISGWRVHSNHETVPKRNSADAKWMKRRMSSVRDGQCHGSDRQG
jgi:hypothetical protein